MPQGVPDPSTITTRQGFAEALTALREQAGLTVREVARTAGLQASTVGGYYGGRHLPPMSAPSVLTQLLTVCGIDDPADHESWRDALLRVRRTPAQRPASSEAPYRGLASFQPEDAEWFFGREELVDALVSRVAAAARRLTVGTGRGLVVVVGASGSGKSSLLRAGLIPALERAAVGGEPWSWVLLTPGDDPAAALTHQLDADPAPDRDLVVIVDQFEELFTACTDEQQRRDFVTRLLDLARRRTGRTVVVAGLRADFYGHATRLPGLVPALQDAQLVVGPMTATQLRRAITEPARRAQVTLEDGLVDLLLGALAPGPAGRVGAPADAAHDPGALPLLSHALMATWQRGRQTTLRIADYLAVGGIDGAVSGTADTVFDALTPPQQEAARRLFRRLVSVSADAADTRRRVGFAELGPEVDDPAGPLRAALDAFVAHRLLTADTDGVEISHDALLGAWPRLRAWVDADRAGLGVHRRLTELSLAWDAADRDPNLLLQGGRLATTQEWATDPDRAVELSPLEQDFLREAGLRADEQRRVQQRTTRRLRWLAASLVTLLVLVAGLAGYALHLQSAASRARDLASSRQVAGESERMRTSDVSVAGRLGVLAYRTADTSQARSALLDAAAMPMAGRMIGPPGVLQSVSTTPGGDLVAAAGEKGVVRLWRAPAAGAPVRQADVPAGGSGATVFATALSRDGRVLAAAGGERRVYLWDVSAPARPTSLGEPLTGPENTVYALAFSPNGSVLAAGCADRTIRLWDLADPARPQPLATIRGSADFVQAVSFSPDGTVLAGAGADRTVRLWNVRDPRHPAPYRGAGPYRGGAGVQLTGAGSTLFGVAFSPDGRTVAGSARDGSVLLWDLSRLPRDLAAVPRANPVLAASVTLSGPGNWVNAVGYSPDGAALAAASSDGKVWVWDTRTGRVRAQLPHPAPVTAVSWRGPGTLFTSCADGAARRWSLPSAPAMGMPGTVFSIGFSRDGTRLAAAGPGIAALWDVDDPSGPTPLGTPVTGAAPTAPRAGAAAPRAGAAAAAAAGELDGAGALSPDGRLLAAGTKAGAVLLWDVTDPGRPRQLGPALPVAGQLVEWTAFSPDGRTLAAGSDDGTVRLVDLRDREHPVVAGPPLTGPGNIVFSVAFSPDGRTLAAATANRTVWRWDVTDVRAPQPLGEPLRGPNSYVYSVAFSPDGRTLAAGTAERTVWRWDVSDRAHPQPLGEPLTGPSNYVYAVAFSPDGRRLAAGAGDGSVWLWDLADRSGPRVQATLSDADGVVYTVAFSADGRTLAAAGADRTIWLWPVDPEQAVHRICGASGDPLTDQEWELSAPGLAHRQIC